MNPSRWTAEITTYRGARPPGVERAQQILDIGSTAPTLPVDLGWLDRAREAGWRG